MSKIPDWFYLLVAVVAFALSWLAARLDRLGKQLEAVSASIREEMANLQGNEERASEILKEWKEDRDWQKKNAPRYWLMWAIIGVAAFGWWWWSVGQH
jgi:hypothetical protein